MYKEEYKKAGVCERCGTELTGQQQRWCSKNCSKLGLKRLWKKRTPEHQREYKRNYRRAGAGVNSPINHLTAKRFREGGECVRCKTKDNLNLHHIIPRRLGGSNSICNLLVLCFPCHMMLEQRMKGFWID